MLPVINHYALLNNVVLLEKTSALAVEFVHYATTATTPLAGHSQRQICQIGLASTGYSIFFSILPLLKAGYLVSAAVLLRAFIERTATIAWLSSGDDKDLQIYLNEWNNPKKRPGIKSRLRCLENYIGNREALAHLNFKISDHLIDDWLDTLNGYVHGDQAQADNHAIHDPHESTFACGPDPNHPDTCNRLASLAVTLMGQFHHEIKRSLPYLMGGEQNQPGNR